jgi:hypothetical protein
METGDWRPVRPALALGASRKRKSAIGGAKRQIKRDDRTPISSDSGLRSEKPRHF